MSFYIRVSHSVTALAQLKINLYVQGKQGKVDQYICFSVRVVIRSSLILFVWHLLLVASWSSIVSFHFYVQFDVAHIHSVVTSNDDLVDDCYICDDLFVRI